MLPRACIASCRKQFCTDGEPYRHALLRQWTQRACRLGRTNQLQKFGSVSKRIVAARGRRDAQDVVIAERAEVASATENLSEGGNAGRKPRLVGRPVETGVLGRAIDRSADERAHIGLGQL